MITSSIMHWSQFLSFVVSMLAITNPASSLAVFLSMTSDKTYQEQRQIVLVTTLAIFIILVIITWLGTPILQMFGIPLAAFEITGGIVLLIRALNMLHSRDTPTSQTAAELQQSKIRESIAIVPLAIPIIAGPGAITTAIIYSQHFSKILEKIYLSFGVAIVAFIIGCTLYFSHTITKIIGTTGIKIVTRIMGLLLASIAMSMITSGIKEIFPGLS